MSRSVLAGAILLALVPAAPAWSHQNRHVGRLETTVGWMEEPAFVGFRNAVEIRLERASGSGHSHGTGDPVENAKLTVEVFFGQAPEGESFGPVDLAPVFGEPGGYRAFIIPTQPGTYTFKIAGRIGKTTFDEVYVSGEAGKNEDSEGTFNDIRETGDEVAFPKQHPTNVELSEKLSAAEARLAAAADSADSTAGTALVLGIVGIVIGIGGVGTAVIARRKAA